MRRKNKKFTRAIKIEFIDTNREFLQKFMISSWKFRRLPIYFWNVSSASLFGTLFFENLIFQKTELLGIRWSAFIWTYVLHITNKSCQNNSPYWLVAQFRMEGRYWPQNIYLITISSCKNYIKFLNCIYYFSIGKCLMNIVNY